MPKTAVPLTVLQIKKLPDGVHCVGGCPGLCVEKRRGYQAYKLRYLSPNGSRRAISFPVTFDLAQARLEGLKLRKLIAEGIDPLDQREAEEAQAALQAETESAPTVKEAFLRWVDAMTDGWSKRNPNRVKQTIQRAERHIFPKLGNMRIAEVTPHDAVACFEGLARDKANEAGKVTTLLRQFFLWTIGQGLRPDGNNPVAKEGVFSTLLKPLAEGAAESEHHSALPYKRAPEFFALLRQKSQDEKDSASSLACMFVMLTLGRSQAVRRARWNQFDFEERLWHIPLQNDKMKTLHALRDIPLSSAAVEFLQALPKLGPDALVFESRQGGTLTSEALRGFLIGLHNKRLAEDGVGWIDVEKSRRQGRPCHITVHGMRSSFRTWAEEDEHGNLHRFDQEAAEMILLHKREDANKQAYRRGSLINERRLLLESWGRYLTTGKWPEELDDAAAEESPQA